MKQFLRFSIAFPLAALLTLSGCKHDSDPIDPITPVETPPATTAYTLVVPSTFPAVTQPADNPLTEQGVELGRHLFYETALSSDNSISCATCHQQAKAFTDGLAHAVGVSGAQHPRSAMALSNLLWEPKLTWDGAASSLETQARIPLENPIEMHQSLATSVARLQTISKYSDLFFKAFGTRTITEANVLKALSQFERTLISSNSRYDQYRATRSGLTPTELQGLLLLQHPDPSRNIRGGNCNDCHGGELFTNHAFANNGLDATFTDLGLAAITGATTDQGKFRVPSLRNIALTAPYMHDGRFATLQDVLDHYNEHIIFNSPNLDPLISAASNTVSTPAQPQPPLGLTADEKRKIIAFLQTLTDTTFTHNRKFAKPVD